MSISSAALKLGLLLVLGVSLSAEAGWFGISGTNWKEEVLLHDGRKIIVERKDIHDSSLPHEIGQGAPLAEHITTFTLPASNQRVTWRSDNRSRSEPDNLDLMVLDFINGVPYAAAGITRCIAYNRWGRPNPPYVFFKYDGKAWQRISLEEFSVEFKEPNVIVGGYDQYSLTVEERGASVLTADTVRRVNKAAGRSPESYTIIREALKTGTPANCGEMIRFESGWASPSYVERTIKQRVDAERRAGKIPNNQGQTTVPQ